MATTVEEAFETYKSDLEITGLEQEAVSSRQKDVHDLLCMEDGNASNV